MKRIIFLASLFLFAHTFALAQTRKDGDKPDLNRGRTLYTVGYVHLDTQWNWDIQTTIKDYVWNTLNQNLFLLNQYPDYIFNFEGGVKYAWMKEYYPREYELMKAFVKAGRWHVSGASWDATDTLVPSVESFIRNIMLGQEFYRKELGVESTDIFLPDCFGFGWTLPTAAAHCGLIGFSSQKLDCVTILSTVRASIPLPSDCGKEWMERPSCWLTDMITVVVGIMKTFQKIDI